MAEDAGGPAMVLPWLTLNKDQTRFRDLTRR